MSENDLFKPAQEVKLKVKKNTEGKTVSGSRCAEIVAHNVLVFILGEFLKLIFQIWAWQMISLVERRGKTCLKSTEVNDNLNPVPSSLHLNHNCFLNPQKETLVHFTLQLYKI